MAGCGLGYCMNWAVGGEEEALLMQVTVPMLDRERLMCGWDTSPWWRLTGY